MLTVYLSIDREGCSAGAPYNREELSNILRDTIVIQGRATYEENGPLPGVYNILFSSRTVRGIRSFDRANLVRLASACDVNVIGGSRTFDAFVPHADLAVVDVYDRICPGYGSPVFDFKTWRVLQAFHCGSMSRYRLIREIK